MLTMDELAVLADESVVEGESELQGEVRRWLTMNNAMVRAPKSWPYRSTYDFVLRHGIFMPWRRKPATIPDMTPKGCFYNAYELTRRDRRLTYCEGFAAGILVTPHAWVIDQEGYVIDATWDGLDHHADDDEPRCYLGVPFKRQYVLDTMKPWHNNFTILERYWENFPLLSGRHSASSAIRGGV